MSENVKCEVSEREYRRLEKQVTLLLKTLKKDIGDEYRACEDDDCPGMQVTIGATPQSDGVLHWSYQTGDNSYTGGAYGHAHWGVIYLYRRTNSKEAAHNAVEEIAESISIRAQLETSHSEPEGGKDVSGCDV